MWVSIESDLNIQVLPEGEEALHFWDSNCSCHPRVSLDIYGKLIITHNACDGRELLEEAYETPLHTVRQKIDC